MTFIEKRAYERVPFFCPVLIAPKPGGISAEARTVDVSIGGVGMVCSGTMVVRPGANVEVTFRLTDPKKGPCEEVVVGRVVNLVADPNGCRIGVEFLEPLRPDTHPRLFRKVDRL
jgi:hypothetical protein